MLTKFKIGDRVRHIKERWEGFVRSVIDSKHQRENSYLIQWDESYKKGGNCYLIKDLEKIEEPEEKKQYEIGDRVRRKIDDIGTGRRGTIKRIAEPCVTQYPVMVDWDDGGEYGVWLSHDQIAPDIDVVTKPEAVESEKGDTFKSDIQNRFNAMKEQHNEHYTKLGDYEPFKVYEAFLDANEELFQDNPKLAGYYLNVIKYLARIQSKDTPLKNVEKARVYLDKLIEILENDE